MVVDKAKKSRLLRSLGKKKKQEKQLEQESKKLNNQQKKQNEQAKKQSGGGQKRGSGNRGTKQTGGGSAAKSNGGGNAFGGAYGYGNGGGSASRGTTVGGFGGGTSRASKSGTVSGFTAKSGGGISIKPTAAEALSNRLNTVSGKSGKNNLDEIYGRILDKRYQEYLAEQRQKAEKPKYRNNGDYIKGVSPEDLATAKEDWENFVDSFKDGKLPNQENVSQRDLDNALKNIDNFHALGVGDYGFDEEASENLQHTANAWAKGSVSRLFDLGVPFVSNSDRMTGGFLSDHFKFVDDLQDAQNRASESYNDELAQIDSKFLKVMGDIGYYAPDIIAAYLTKGKSLEMTGGELLGKIPTVASRVLNKETLAAATTYINQFIDSNLANGMKTEDVLKAAALYFPFLAVLGAKGGGADSKVVSAVDRMQAAGGGGALGVANNIAGNISKKRYDDDMLWFDDGSGQRAVFSGPKMMEAFAVGALKSAASGSGSGKSRAEKSSTSQKGGAGKVGGSKSGGTVGGSSKAVGPVPVLSEAEKREIQKKMIEELFRRYYPYSDFFGWK